MSTAAAAQRAEAAGDLARPLAQLRRRPAARAQPRDPAARLRPRRHPLRPGQQLRPAVRLRGGELRPDPARRPARRTATSWSSPPRPATTCGPAPTATGARASTCSPASTRASRGMGLDYVDIFYSHRPDPDTPLEETMGALDTPCGRARRCTPGSRRTRPSRRARRPRSSRDLGTPLLIHQPSYSMLNRWIERGLLDALASSASAASSSRRSRRAC